METFDVQSFIEKAVFFVVVLFVVLCCFYWIPDWQYKHCMKSDREKKRCYFRTSINHCRTGKGCWMLFPLHAYRKSLESNSISIVIQNKWFCDLVRIALSNLLNDEWKTTVLAIVWWEGKTTKPTPITVAAALASEKKMTTVKCSNICE